MNHPNKNNLIAQIIAGALGPLADWQPPVPLRSIGPAFPEVFAAFATRLEELRRDLQAALSEYSVEELEADFPDSEAPSLNPLFNRTGRHGALAKRLIKAKAEVPQNFVGGWSIKGKEIDLSYWRGVATYSVAEAALLSVGRDPRTVIFEALFPGTGRSGEENKLLDFLEDQHDSIARGCGLDPEDNTSQISASDFLEWVRTHKIPVDPRFRRMLNESWKDKNAAQGLPPGAQEARNKPLHGSSLKVHARIITVMAWKNYGFVQKDQIREIAKEVQHDADHLGMGFDIKVLQNLLEVGLRDFKQHNPEE